MAEEAEQRHELRVILEIAEALRTELGALIRPGDVLAERLTSMLSHAACARLERARLNGRQVHQQLTGEPAGRDDWLAFLILTGWTEILLLVDPDLTDSD